MYICHIVSTVDINECIFYINEQQKVYLKCWVKGGALLTGKGGKSLRRDLQYFETPIAVCNDKNSS